MDYEKLHKDTIAKLQEMVNSGKITVKIACGICADFVPESEDERIRKKLIALIEWSKSYAASGITTDEAKEIITYLEKQGEQKPIIEMKSAEESLGIDSETYNKIVDECIYGEQKSSWSEEDNQIALSIEQVMNCASLLNIVPEKMDKIRTWLKSLKDRVCCEANCTTAKEWSEEDEKMIRGLIVICDEWTTRHSFYPIENCEIEKLKNWLESLKERVLPQPKQGWTEDDYNAIETIACHLDNTDNEGLAEVLRNIRDKYYHIIPQSTWKPSEEQMKALKHASNDCSIAFADMKILATLYEQLKALHRYEQDT